MLTRKQRELLLYIHERMQSGDIAPSFDEMKDALNLKSKSGIHRLISGLVERGYLERLPNRARALQVVKMPEVQSNDNQTAPSSSPLMSAMPGFVQIPLLGKIAAGTPIEAIRHEDQMLDVAADMVGKGEHYALKIDGDSMINAGIHHGDTVIIKRCDRVDNGDIAVALVDGQEVTLKRYYRDNDHVILKPENEDYMDQAFAADQVQVQGRLVSLLRVY